MPMFFTVSLLLYKHIENNKKKQCQIPPYFANRLYLQNMEESDSFSFFIDSESNSKAPKLEQYIKPQTLFALTKMRLELEC